MQKQARNARRAAIVIFGAAVRADGSASMTLRRRVQAAAVWGRRLPVEPLFVPTGGVGRHGPSEASVMAGLLRDLGVPDERILLEESGSDTLSSVRAVAALLRARGHDGPVYAASSAYHLARCVLLLRLTGLPARASRPPPFPAGHNFRTRWFWRLREFAALPVDAALILVRRHPRRT